MFAVFCRTCRESKPLSAFPRYARGGCRPDCRACRNAKEREKARHRRADPARRAYLNRWHREYRRTHPDKNAESCRRYYERHRDEQRAKQREYRQTHKDEINAYHREYYAKHRDYCRQQAREAYARRKAARRD